MKLGISFTLNAAIMKKYAEIFLHYRWLFIKGNAIIGEWGIFGVEVSLHYSQFFVKGDFVIGRVECTFFPGCLSLAVFNFAAAIIYVSLSIFSDSIEKVSSQYLNV